MTRRDPIDCVVVGHNDVDFERRAVTARRQASASGLYQDLQMNSVLLEGRRTTYMDLLDRARTAATGRRAGLDVFRSPSLAVVHLTSLLRRRGFSAEYVNSFNHDKERLLELLARAPATVAVTTTYYVESEPVREIVELVRRHAPFARIIVGGPYIYNLCEDLDALSLEYALRRLIGADIYIHDAQGEATLCAVVDAVRAGRLEELRDIPNVILLEPAGKDGMIRTGRVVESNGLDDNRIDWGSFPAGFFAPMVSLRTARSCPYSCSFCNYPTMAGPHVLLGLDGLEAELRFLHECGVRYVNFIDDTFNVPLPRFKQLLRMMIRNHFDFRWVSFLRCSNADGETFTLMREAGCVAVFLGIESGHPEILKNMHKQVAPSRYRYGITKLTENGIFSLASIIVGFPGETADTVRTTIEFLESTRPTFFNAQLYYHDRRTPIHRRAAEFAITGAGYSWSHAAMGWREAAAWTKTMLATVSGSIPLTLYGFSIWAFPYLLANGITLEQLAGFGRAARPMLVAGFDEVGFDQANPAFRGLVGVLREASPAAEEPAGSHAGRPYDG